MKKLLAALLTLLFCGCASAEVIAPYGIGQIGYEAVVLCQSLTVRAERSTAAKAVATLRAGDIFATLSSVDGWLDCFRSETEGRTGWVRAEYAVVDPAWYTIEQSTPVYAYADLNGPRVGLLDKGERYPILKAQGEWLVIGLRGASGWIHDAAAAQAAEQSMFAPEKLAAILRAELMAPDGKTHALTDESKLQRLGALFSAARPVTATKCPFDAVLNMTLADGSVWSLELATDSCSVFRAAGDAYYDYGGDSRQFWALFGLDMNDLYR
ncbi:MAG: SH3 domain-containing protein [Clostridia bacterium]|nr:SH3 domain-containing protein [Clostridia bacterium]